MSSFLLGASNSKPACNLNVTGVFPIKVATAIADVTTLTPTAAQMLGGILTAATLGAGLALTTPTAADIIAAMPNPSVGSSFECRIFNKGANTITVGGGSGVVTTAASALTIATVTAKTLLFVVTSPTAVALYM